MRSARILRWTLPIVLASAVCAPAQAGSAYGANPSALSGLGRLAVTVPGGIAIVDGIAGRTVFVRVPASIGSLVWSSDGRWLAFTTAGLGGTGPIELVRSDGKGLHKVTGQAGSVAATAPMPSFTWIPGEDSLAVASSTEGVWVVPATGRPERLALAGTHVQALTASPDGKELAAVVTLPSKDVTQRRDEVLSIAVQSGTSRRVYVASGPSGVDLAGFWPDGRGLLFWLDPLHSGSLAADGLGLFSMPLSTGSAKLLAVTLPYRQWLAWGPSGDRLAVVAGPDRIAWVGKRLLECDADNAMCDALGIPGGIAPMDPIFASGRLLFVGARAMPSTTWGFQSQAAMISWVQSRRLFVRTGSGSAVEVLARGGVYVPTAAGSGHVLYIAGGSVWIRTSWGGTSARVIGVQPPNFGFYGELWPTLAFWPGGTR